MSGTVSTRFYFSDWQSDAGVRASSLAARGLWMEILAVAAQNKNGDHGFLLIAGRKVTMKEIARLASCAEEEIEPLLAELEANGVFNRDKRGVIYCRRMVNNRKYLRESISTTVRDIIFERDNYRCVYCGDEDGPFHLDHVVPVIAGGRSSYSNLVVACRTCNLSKGAKPLAEWRQ